jgi:chemotaxis protein MotC
MTTLRMAVALVACFVLAAPAARAGEGESKAPPVTPIAGPPTPISDLVVDVQRLQARLAMGDKAAYPLSRERIKEAGKAIASAAPDDFKIPEERAAVVAYLLSGGQPRDVAAIVDRGDFPKEERELLRGAIGYVGGQQAQAEALLPFDPYKASLRLGGQLAFAQSVLTAPKDARKALELLDIARILAPGTLVEEAALRREILLVGDLRETPRVAFLARQYVERYGRSLYAGNFVASLARTAIRSDLCATPSDLAKFSALLRLIAPEQARNFLLSVARASLPLGRFEVAAAAAADALTTAPARSPDELKGKVYQLAARFPKLPEVEAIAAFSAIPADKLAPEDRMLFKAAVYTHAWLYETPQNAIYDDSYREARIATARSPSLPPPTDPVTATIGRAAAAIAGAEALAARESAK